MLQLSWIFIWIASGLFLRESLQRNKINPSVISRRLNSFIIWISLPSTILLSLHRLQFDSSLWLPISMAWIVFAVAALFFIFLGKLSGWSKPTVGALILTAGLGNTSFVGFPLLRALLGEASIPTAVLNDQPGTFLVLSTLGILCASTFSERSTSKLKILLRILIFPPVWATGLALILHSTPFPGELETGLKFGLKSLTPLALISVGMHLTLSRGLFQRELKPLASGLLYKLFFAPVLILILFNSFFEAQVDVTRISTLEAAMGPMVTGVIIARDYGLDPELCTMMASFGIPFCLITVPIWSILLRVLN